MNKISVISLTLSVLLFHAAAYAQDSGRSAAATWQVQKYDLNVTLPQDSARIVAVKAVVNLRNVSQKPASTLTLRITPLAEVTSLKINDAIVDFTKNEEKINSSSSLQRLGVRFASVSPDALLTATIEYKIGLKDNTALSSVSPTNAQFLPLSYWYPTPNSWFYARGADMAPTHIKVNAAVGQTAVSAGNEVAGTFEQKLNGQPFFVAGSWDVSNQSGVTVYSPKGTGADGQKRAAELAALLTEAKAFAGGILGKAPDVPLRLISGRRGAGFGSGGTVVVDESVFRRSKIDSLTVMNIAEAAAKLWLGNAVSVTGEGYGVISEGLSRYIATQFIESKFGKDVADVERLRQRVSYAAVSKRDAPISTVSPLDDFYYTEVANKGSMVWRLVAKRVGGAEFSDIIRANAQDGNLNLAELRAAFSLQKDLLDNLLDKVTEMNLLAGLPQSNGSETKVALRNTGETDATINVTATTITGEKITAPSTIRATSFGEISFKTGSKIIRVEVDSDKLYPQTEYWDDVAPRESSDSDPLLTAKRYFDKQDFVNAEITARTLLRDSPRFDDLRILLGRSLLSQNKNTEAEKEFRAVLDEKLPTSRSIAWANVGLAEIASRSSQTDAALKYVEAAIITDADYGASLAARNLRNKLGYASAADASVKAFFADFDRAATANRKADVDALTMPGEVTKFAGGVSGSTEQWQTQVRQIDRIDASTVLVEASMTIKLLNKETETGMAVYRLTKVGTGWKLSTVEMFEVR